MNAVEMEKAISALAEQPFDGAEILYLRLEAFGNNATTIRRPVAGASNKSDLSGVLHTNNLHIAVADTGRVTERLAEFGACPATKRECQSSSSQRMERHSGPKTRRVQSRVSWSGSSL